MKNNLLFVVDFIYDLDYMILFLLISLVMFVDLIVVIVW